MFAIVFKLRNGERVRELLKRTVQAKPEAPPVILERMAI